MDWIPFSFDLLWKTGVASFIALFAPINPVGTAMIVNPFFDGLDIAQRRVAVRKLATYCFILAVLVIAGGEAVLRLFGLEFSVIRMGGGLILCAIAWRMLFGLDEKRNSEREAAAAASAKEQVLTQIDSKLFYPLAFPFTLGPGSIAVLLSLTAHSQENSIGAYLWHMLAILGAVVAVIVVTYFCFTYTEVLVRRLGKSGAQVLNRISAFLVFCVGLQMVITGLSEALHL